MNPKLNESVQEVQYPQRPGEADCTYYMRTGICGFGSKCKYNHPPRHMNEKECSYYVRTGYCRFGKHCKFHHPQPSGIPMPMTASTFLPTQQQHMVAVPMPTSSFLPAILPQGLVLAPGWTPYPVEVGATALSDHLYQWAGANFMYIPRYQMDPLIPTVHSADSSYFSLPAPSEPLSISAQPKHVFPERPGQPECQFYKRTGNCKFGKACKYHHPRDRYVLSRSTSCALSPIGLPLRPGAPTCSFYAHHGICKFGPTCKFDHAMGTMSYSPSASSLTDMAVAPYPVSATVAPSTTSELQTEAVVVMSKDANSTSEAPLLPSTS